MIHHFLDKKYKDYGVNNEIKQNEQLAEEPHKPIIKNQKRKSIYIYISFKNNI